MSTVDLVVTRYREPLAWLNPFFERPGWNIYIYNTGKKPPPPRICKRAAQCLQVPNAGFEWHGYLRHLVDRYDRLAELTIFMQADPFTVSPDALCLLNQTNLYAPLQVLSWVQQAKRKMEIFSTCKHVQSLGGCRVWIEPVTAALRPMLHGDRWLHRACRLAKRFKGSLFQFLYAQLGVDDPKLTVSPGDVHRALIQQQSVPNPLYRAYGAQFAARREVLRERQPAFYSRLLKWLTTYHDDMGRAGFLPIWRAYTTKEKAILLELIWMSLFRAERFVKADVCNSCLADAKALPVPADAIGPSCTNDYFNGAPRVEACNVTGDGWGGPPSKRLKMRCPITKNDDEVAAG